MIRRIRLGTIRFDLDRPFKTALRTVTQHREIAVVVETHEGLLGFGEAPPTPPITGETLGSIRGAVEDRLAPALIGRDEDDLEGNLRALHGAMHGNASAKAALDVALHDLWARRLGAPVHRLLGGAEGRVRTDMTISVDDPEIMARDAAEAVARGFDVLKVKVGKDGREDLRRLRAVREAAGVDVALRIDANQGWTPREAVTSLRAMEDEGLAIELVEQPVAAADLAGMAWVRERVATPILADESIHGPEDALAVARAGAADLLNIKLMKCGGLARAQQICTVAELHGLECMVGCMLEGRATVSAAAHLAAARSVITRVDLDGPMLLGSDPFEGGARFEGPVIELSGAPGFGIEGVEGMGTFEAITAD